MTAKIYSYEDALSRRLPALRLGTLEIQGDRIVLKADCRLTASAARTLAANLIVMAERVEESK